MIRFLKTTLLGGFLFVLPFVVVILILEKAVDLVQKALAPIVSSLPPQLNHSFLIAMILILGFCFFAGLMLQTRLGKNVARGIEETILEKIPGYRRLRDLSSRLMGQSEDHRFQTVLIESGDCKELGLLVEENQGGQCTVFIPGVPNPTAGELKIVAKVNVHFLDVSVKEILRCLSAWGVGSNKLLKDFKGEEKR